MEEEQDKKEEKAPAAAPAPAARPVAPAATAAAPAKPAAAAPAAAAAKPAPPPKVEAPSLPPLQMLSPRLKMVLEEKVRSGETVTIEVGKESFTGRIFRIMLHEGWIALEHVDGRRRPFYVITGGRITTANGETLELAGGHAK